jgi:hypothetical protein
VEASSQVREVLAGVKILTLCQPFLSQRLGKTKSLMGPLGTSLYLGSRFAFFPKFIAPGPTSVRTYLDECRRGAIDTLDTIVS